ncbi:MAG: ADP-ribosylglycohydrolase family protein [Chloroflexi bacterium]|nr:ADP-ribosylglycohydrolase family protein [Chloroflexota bacterium]
MSGETRGVGPSPTPAMRDRLRGCAVGAAVGDALGMPLEFGLPLPEGKLQWEMRSGRLPAGAFTDDTEMALALADSLLAHRPLDPADLGRRFVAWMQAGPSDVGIHTMEVLHRSAAAQGWREAVEAVYAQRPDAAGNGSVMRCWPVALAHWGDRAQLLADSRLQSQVTHLHDECVAGSAFVCAAIAELVQGAAPADAVGRALEQAQAPAALAEAIEAAPRRQRRELTSSGWVRSTLQAAVWGFLRFPTFGEAVAQVVSLGGDADTAGTVVGALAGAAYGLAGIPLRWQEALRGEWPLRSGTIWRAGDLIALADRLAGCDPCA